MKYLKFLVLLAIISCSNVENRPHIEDTYRTSGVEQFLLPELPTWANSSADGSCFKTKSIQYLDFAKLSSTYQLDYAQMIEFQAQYNEKIEAYFKSTTARFLKPVEEASFFSNSLEHVRGGIKKFNIPEMVNEVDVIWLEGFIKQKKVSSLVARAKSEEFNEKLPVLYSSCLTLDALARWVKEHDLEEVGLYLLPAEWLNPFSSDLKLRAGLRVELRKLFNAKVKINVITPSTRVGTRELII